MVLKVATTSLHLSQPWVPPSPSSSQTLASAILSPSSRRRSFSGGNGALLCRNGDRSLFFSTHQNSKLYRSRSCNNLRSKVPTIRRVLSASLNSSSDEEFSNDNPDPTLRFQSSAENANSHSGSFDAHEKSSDYAGIWSQNANDCGAGFMDNLKPFDTAKPPEFHEIDDMIPVDIERKANSVEIPLSLRIIKRKIKWQGGFMEAGQSAYCSVKKAFSSMVFIIRELHCYTLQMRQLLFYEDLRGILERVEKEMHESFVWLFQQVFSHTPTLMVYVMILLANYSVHSMSNNAGIAATNLQSYAATTEAVHMVDEQNSVNQKFDSSAFRGLKSFSPNGKIALVNGNNGGGGKDRLVASGTDGDGRFSDSNCHQTIVPEKTSLSENPSNTNGEESVLSKPSDEEESRLWNSVVDDSSKMQASSTNEMLDHETKLNFVSPVYAKIEDEDQTQFFRTELLYQAQIARDPNNPLLLTNYAQFLYVVVQDFDRAEEYFKKATKMEPKDAEALNKYANFLWLARKDLWAAEETYLEALDAEPKNTHLVGNYAHFLWRTGGEDTCLPLA